MKFSKEKEESIIQDYLKGYNTVQIAKNGILIILVLEGYY